MHITGGRGVDVVYDPVGKIKGSCPPERRGKWCKYTRILMGSVDALKCIAWGGRALVVGFAGGAIEQVCTLSCWRGKVTLIIRISISDFMNVVISSRSTLSFSRMFPLSASSGARTLVR
jgi:threonine dehydrogenase-like Zn-dependent dehydrogenase